MKGEDIVSTITLSVVIPTWRRTAQLINLLDALHKQIRKPDEIIIACRQNDNDTLEAVRRWASQSPLGSKSKIAQVYTEGHLPPLIAALEICEADVFCQIDDDAIPREDWLMNFEKNFRYPHIGGIGGIIINNWREEKGIDFNRPGIETPGKLSWFGRSGRYGRLAKNNKLFESDCFIGCNMAFRRNALEGSIDMMLNGGSAISYETDIALNVRHKGFDLFYDPEVVVDHYPVARKIDAKRGWNPMECFWYAHNLTYICLKHFRWYGKLAFLLYFFIGGTWGCPAPITYLLSIFRGRSVSWKDQFLPSLKGRIAGIKTYFRRLEVEKAKCGK